MLYRELGQTGETVSALGIGSWHTWDRGAFEEVVQVVRAAVDAGVALFDVGVYRSKGPESIQPYDSPTDLLFSAAVQRAGLVAGKDFKLSIKAWLNKPGHTVTSQVENLLWRGGYDSADYLVLGDAVEDPGDFTPLLLELGALVQSGKVRHWAVNNWSGEQVIRVTAQAAAAGVPVPQFAQLKYGITRRSVAEGPSFAAALTQTGITIQASDTFDGGLIFGSATTRIVANDPGHIWDRLRDSVPAIAAAAAALSTTVSALGIAFDLTNPAVSNVLIGCRTLDHLNDALGAFELLDRLSPEDIRAAVAEFWLDQDVVDPDASWGSRAVEAPSNYGVVPKPTYA